MTTATTDLPTLLTAITALENAARYDDALALVDATEVADERDRLELLMARASVVARRDYTRGVPLLRRPPAGGRPGAGGPDRHRADRGLGPRHAAPAPAVRRPAGRRHRARRPGRGRRGRDDGRGRPPARHRAGGRPTRLGLHVPGLVRRQPARRPGRGAPSLQRGARRRPGRWATRCWSSRPSGTSATTPTTTATTAGALAAWEESAAAAARGGHVLGVLAQQVLLAVLARDAGDEAGARALAAEDAAMGRAARGDPAGRPGRRLPGRGGPHGAAAGGRRQAVRPPSRILGRLGYGMTRRSGDRLPWLHAPGPSRTHATRRLTQSSQRVTPRCPAQQRGFLLVEEHRARIEEEDPIG